MGMALFYRDDRDGALVSDKEDPAGAKGKEISGQSISDNSFFHGNLSSGDRSSRGDDPPVW